ncbi:MAG: MFS transporter [Ktedonobacteraceae bacterium]|nr:MFS transporter [Ktedonobacteraceae bacterium]
MKVSSSAEKSLWRDPSFVLYWSGSIISVLGSYVTLVLLPILVYRLTNSAFQTALLTALNVVPYFCFGLFAGVLADRVNRKRLMVLCNLGSMLAIGSIPFASLLHVLTLPHIYIAALLVATVTVWFDAADFGALPALVGRERVVAANSYLQSAATFLGILGPSIAGILAAALSPALALSADALSYALAAVSLLFIPRAFNALRTQDTGQHSFVKRTITDIREGLHFLLHQPLVRTMTFLGFGNSFTGGAVTGLLVVYAVRGLALSKNDARIGLLFTAGAIGSLLAGLLLPRLVKRFPVGYITLLGLCVTPLALLGLAFSSSLIVSLLLYGLWDACYTLTIINGISLRQMVTPDHLQGRVNTTARMIAWGGTPFGAAIGGILAQVLDVRLTYLIMAGGVALSALIGWFSPLRQAQAVSPSVASE